MENGLWNGCGKGLFALIDSRSDWVGKGEGKREERRGQRPDWGA